MSAVWGRMAKKLLAKLFWMAAALFFSLVSFSQTTADKPVVSGRLIDLTCGSMSLRGDHFLVIHSGSCLADPRSRGGLAILADYGAGLVHLNREQEAQAVAWRKDLAFGEVYVYFNKDSKLHRVVEGKIDNSGVGK